MPNRLAVHFTARRENKVQTCHEVQEGDNGLHLVNDHSEQVGYVPYDKLQFVEGLVDE